MRALVISGGGSKGAFAGGVAEYLIAIEKKKYAIFVGTSTGSLMVSHLAADNLKGLKELYTNICPNQIFSTNPFKITKHKGGGRDISINHFNTLLSLIKGHKTFGESKNLLKLIRNNVTREMYENLLVSDKEVIVTVSNITLNRVEYKRLKDYSYDDFCEWIWASSNYAPFMSILNKNNFEYADGGFGTLVPIKKAIDMGAKEIDVVVLETEHPQFNRMPTKNPFSLLTTLFGFMLEHIGKHNITIGKLDAKLNNVCLNLYHTPTILTTNSLIFDKKKMTKWWQQGFDFAKNQNKFKMNELKEGCY